MTCRAPTISRTADARVRKVDSRTTKPEEGETVNKWSARHGRRAGRRVDVALLYTSLHSGSARAHQPVNTRAPGPFKFSSQWNCTVQSDPVRSSWSCAAGTPAAAAQVRTRTSSELLRAAQQVPSPVRTERSGLRVPTDTEPTVTRTGPLWSRNRPAFTPVRFHVT